MNVSLYSHTGLISAAKVVGIAANYLVDAADRCVAGDAKMEELIVASQEISAATAQLLVASKVSIYLIRLYIYIIMYHLII